jgi:hypothetical protein
VIVLYPVPRSTADPGEFLCGRNLITQWSDRPLSPCDLREKVGQRLTVVIDAYAARLMCHCFGHALLELHVSVPPYER